MTSPPERPTSASRKKRLGRKRLPPLAPGPNLQFVVAQHPDDFKADETMRNIRSHVMYKHRAAEQKGSRSPSSRSQVLTRTPSPMTTTSDGPAEGSAAGRRRSTIWAGDFCKLMAQSTEISPMRRLAAKIMCATSSEVVQSAPPALTEDTGEYPFPAPDEYVPEPLDDLKGLYISMSSDFYSSGDHSWMEVICSSRMLLLSHVSVFLVYQDVIDRFLDDSALTVYVKTRVLRMLKDSLQGQTDDYTILSILHLLMNEVGGFDESIFDMHQQALIRIVHQRGGIHRLGLDGLVAMVLTVVTLTFAVLRGQQELPLLHGFVPSRRNSQTMDHIPPLSPLYCPQGDIRGLLSSIQCSNGTYEILYDMQDITQSFMLRWNYGNNTYPPRSHEEIASYDSHMQQIYTRLLLRPSADDDPNPDYVYESCRLAALIYCRSIVHGVPFHESANIMHARSSGVEEPFASLDAGYSHLSALHNALDCTDKANCWGDMSGVFLWICLVGGAASWQATAPLYGEVGDMQSVGAWMRKDFALYAVKASLGLGFRDSQAVVEAQRMMLQVQNLINLKRGISSQ